MVRQGYPKDWKQLAKRILERDGYICAWCGADLRERGVTASVDHIVSLKDGRAEGWTNQELNDPSNLAAACRSCNSSRRGHGPPGRLNQGRSSDSERNDRPRAAWIGIHLSREDKTRQQRWKMKPGGQG